MKRFALLLLFSSALMAGCGGQENASQTPVTVTVPAATMTVPSNLERTQLPVTITGNGNKITESGIPLQAGPASVTMQYNGEGNFIVYFRDAEAFCEVFEEPIIRTAGRYSESKSIDVPQAGSYLFEMRADPGDWSVVIDQ
jgi:hypothetical protein